MKNDQAGIAFAKNGNIGFVTFSHPKSNSLPLGLLNELAHTIEEAGQDEEVKVVVLKSGGEKAFCAGASFDELLEIGDFENAKAFFSGFARVINAMRKCPKFIVARVHGKAVGGGVGLIAAADYAFAISSADIKMSELSIGIGPFVVSPAIERKIGKGAFASLCINPGEWQKAQWAHANGLYNQLFTNIENLDSTLESLVEKLATYNPEAMALIKKANWEGTDHWDTLLEERAAMSGKLALSEFTRTTIAKLKKR